MDKVKVIQAIYCSKKRRGKGAEYSPVRIVTELFDLEGNLISENDPEVIYTKRDMMRFADYVLFHKDNPVPMDNLFKRWCGAIDGKVSIDEDL